MEFQTTTEVSARTGISRVTLWRYSKRFHDFPRPVLIGGVKRWVSKEIDDWLLSHRTNEGEGQ
jgi:predicted DNA-binding transcriptional regulator AlpA